MINTKWLLGIVLAGALAGLSACGGGQGGAGGGTQELSAKDAVEQVQQGEIFQQLQQDPQMVNQIAQYPYAAYILAQQQGFPQWASQNAQAATEIVDSAEDWQELSPQEQQQFLKENDLEQQGGAQGGQPQEMTVEEAVKQAQQQDVFKQLQESPGMVQQIYYYPYAAYILAQQPGFQQWAQQNTEQAKEVLDSAEEWQETPQQQQQQYLQENDLEPQGGAQGSGTQQEQEGNVLTPEQEQNAR